MTYQELYKMAMEAFKDPTTRLSKDRSIHRSMYMLRNKHLITKKTKAQKKAQELQKKIKKVDSTDMRKGGMIISTVNNLKNK
tara:strand:- start:652 stop:897 length:246 start_codon:yes stop_codon:yes gene_type:complete